jgi:hypothetical protein
MVQDPECRYGILAMFILSILLSLLADELKITSNLYYDILCCQSTGKNNIHKNPSFIRHVLQFEEGGAGFEE